MPDDDEAFAALLAEAVEKRIAYQDAMRALDAASKADDEAWDAALAAHLLAVPLSSVHTFQRVFQGAVRKARAAREREEGREMDDELYQEGDDCPNCSPDDPGWGKLMPSFPDDDPRKGVKCPSCGWGQRHAPVIAQGAPGPAREGEGG